MGNAANIGMRMILAALKRMDEGGCGYCVGCGDAIGKGRLAILPATPLCAACAGRHS